MKNTVKRTTGQVGLNSLSEFTHCSAVLQANGECIIPFYKACIGLLRKEALRNASSPDISQTLAV